MNNYKIKKTKKLIKQLQSYWKELDIAEAKFRQATAEIEKRMEKETGIKGIEFFMCDNEYVGIGNLATTMELIHRRELEEGKIINYE